MMVDERSASQSTTAQNLNSDNEQPLSTDDTLDKHWKIERRASRRRHGLFVFSCFYIFLFVGAFFGWGPMQLMLEENGTFSSKCDGYVPDENDPKDICPAQSSALVNVHFFAQMMQIASPLLGIVIDRHGPVSMAFFMAAMNWLGLTLLILAASYVDALLYPAFLLLGLSTFSGGMMTVHTGMIFAEGNRMRHRVIIVLNAMFDAGAITWLGLWAIDHGTSSSFTLSNLLTIYLIFSVVVFGMTLYFWTVVEPEQAATHIDDEHEEAEAVGNEQVGVVVDVDSATDTANAKANEGKEPLVTDESRSEMLPIDEATPTSTLGEKSEPIPDENYVLVRDRTPKQQLLSFPFAIFLTFWTIAVTYNMYIITTIRDFLAFLGDDETGNKYLTIFTLLMPASLVAVPFTDETLHKIGFHGGFQAMNGMCLLFSLIRLLSSDLNVQILWFIIYSFWRSFLFGVCFSFLPTLVSPSLVGTATGILFFVTGVTAFLNVPLSNYAIEEKGGDFFVPNLIYTCLIGVCVVAAWFIGKVNRHEMRIIAERKAARRDSLKERTRE